MRSLVPVREWLRIRPKAQVDKFIQGTSRTGQIEVTAMFFNMSELSGENNYKTFLEPVARFRELGLPVETAMQNDVNGIAWCLADYLPDLGVKYFSIGSNNHRASSRSTARHSTAGNPRRARGC